MTDKNGNIKYGVWNNIDKRFVFGIVAKTKKEAATALFDKIGYKSYCWRYEVKKIPPHFKNPPNPRQY